MPSTVPAAVTRRPPPVRYRSLFPVLEPARPVGWFFAEQLLEARAVSDRPTNGRTADEDVNVYLIGLLVNWAADDARHGVLPGCDPMHQPPDRRGTVATIEHLRRQADHRLLALGLFDRGDLVRRRRVGWRLGEDEARARDLATARHCYELAARYAARRRDGRQHLTMVWLKLAADLDAYVHVLQTLARRQLGLGAKLSDNALERLLVATG